MDIAERAKSAVPVLRCGDIGSTAYRLLSGQLLPAEEVGTDQYPQYGYWAKVMAIDRNGADIGERFLECPGGFAAELDSNDIEPGDSFQVEEPQKTEDDTWTFVVHAVDL